MRLNEDPANKIPGNVGMEGERETNVEVKMPLIQVKVMIDESRRQKWEDSAPADLSGDACKEWTRKRML